MRLFLPLSDPRNSHVLQVVVVGERGTYTGLGEKVVPRFGEFCCCSCSPLLPGFACRIHATWEHLLAQPCIHGNQGPQRQMGANWRNNGSQSLSPSQFFTCSHMDACRLYFIHREGIALIEPAVLRPTKRCADFGQQDMGMARQKSRETAVRSFSQPCNILLVRLCIGTLRLTTA